MIRDPARFCQALNLIAKKYVDRLKYILSINLQHSQRAVNEISHYPSNFPGHVVEPSAANGPSLDDTHRPESGVGG